MSDGPYRRERTIPQSDAALARLAAEGQHRILEASARTANAPDLAARRRDTNLRIALGVHYGTPLRRLGVAVTAAGIAVAIASTWLAGETAAWVGTAGAIVAVAGVLLRVVPGPAATRARVAAERAWLAGLPFAVDGYFEMLEAIPTFACHLVVAVTWEAGPAPAPEIVQALLGLWDTTAHVTLGEPGGLGIRSGLFVCGYLANARRWAADSDMRPTRRAVGRVHGLVDRVLLPLHRSHAIRHVSIEREAVPYASPITLRDVLGS